MELGDLTAEIGRQEDVQAAILGEEGHQAAGERDGDALRGAHAWDERRGGGEEGGTQCATHSHGDRCIRGDGNSAFKAPEKEMGTAMRCREVLWKHT